MKGWVGLVGWPTADGLPTLVVTHQLQVECRTGKVRWPETDVLPLCHATNVGRARNTVSSLNTTMQTTVSNCEHDNVTVADGVTPMSNAAFPNIWYHQRLTSSTIVRTYSIPTANTHDCEDLQCLNSQHTRLWRPTASQQPTHTIVRIYSGPTVNTHDCEDLQCPNSQHTRLWGSTVSQQSTHTTVKTYSVPTANTHDCEDLQCSNSQHTRLWGSTMSQQPTDTIVLSLIHIWRCRRRG